MNGEPFDFQPRRTLEGKALPLELEDVIFQAIGAGSTCWEKLEEAGIFQSTQAKQIGDRVVEWIRANYVHAPMVEPDIEPHIFDEIREEMGLGPLARVVDLREETDTFVLELPRETEILETETYEIMSGDQEEPVATYTVASRREREPDTKELQVINGAAQMVELPPVPIPATIVVAPAVRVDEGSPA